MSKLYNQPVFRKSTPINNGVSENINSLDTYIKSDPLLSLALPERKK